MVIDKISFSALANSLRVQRCQLSRIQSAINNSNYALVFPYQTGWQYCDGKPPNGETNARVMRKITILDQYLAVSQK